MMSKTTLSSLAAAAALIASLGAHAEEVRSDSGRVSFQAQAAAEIENDTMRAVLYVEDEDPSPPKLAERVNRALADAVRIARSVEGVKVKTGGYNTWPIYDRTRIVRWRARTDLIVEGSDFRRVSELVGRLQTTLRLGGIDFGVSPEARRKAEDALLAGAIGEFRDRAARIAEAFGARGWRVRDVSVNAEGGMPPPVPRMVMASKAVAADEVATPPSVEGGTSRVVMVVSGTVEME
jgi:predicted secreted protein